MEGWTCSRCGKRHEEVPLAYSFEAPELWYQIPESERKMRAQLSPDQCVIDRQYFFVAANIEVPVHSNDDPLAWTVWVSLSEKSFLRMSELWETPGREKEPTYFGWLQSHILIYPETLNLKTHVHTRPVGIRPFVELEPTDHPLAIEQREGITRGRVIEIAELALHG